MPWWSGENRGGALMLEKPKARLKRAIRQASRSNNPIVRRGYVGVRNTARRTINAVTSRQLGWVATLWSARWDGDVLEVRGWAYVRDFGFPDAPPTITVWLQRGSERIEAALEPIIDPEVNARASSASEFDYANTAFIARIDAARLRDAGQDTRSWTTFIEVTGRGRTTRGTFRSRYGLASAGHLFARTVGDVQVVPMWTPRGLQIGCRRLRALATDIAIDARRLRLTVSTDLEPVAAAAVAEELSQPLTCRRAEDGDGRTWVIEGELDRTRPVELVDPSIAVMWGIELRSASGSVHPVRTDLDVQIAPAPPEATLLATSGRDGELVLLDAPRQAVVDATEYVRDPQPMLRITGRLFGRDAEMWAQFWGPRQVLPSEIVVKPDRTFELNLPLLASVWGQEALPPRIGSYRIQIRPKGKRRIPVHTHPQLTASLPQAYDGPRFRFRLQSGPNQRFQFRVSPPRRPDEMGQYHQRLLSARYRTTAWTPRNAVYFESFYGRNSTCNPRALDAVIARQYPQLTRLWGVVDGSVPIPPGAIPVIQGTREWWEARATSRYVIANDWLRRWFMPQPFQIVLQTWHGSMFKRIGLDRANLPKEKQRSLMREQSKWDVLLSQNHHSSEIFATAYAWDRPILEEGYPRDDRLHHAEGTDLRHRLGIPDGKTAILYAPTWRENLTEMVAFLDVERLCADLGDDYIVLLRGHSRTVEFGESVTIPGVIDVTTYPEITDLFLAADALITDYSSVMFDYSVTRRPMIFFTPDMADYRDTLRGTYFDLEELAPGPVLFTQEQVTQAIRELDTQNERFAERYQRWHERFNHCDDGHSGERVVARLMAMRKIAEPDGTTRLEL
ncbi:MAG TPA: CDP-glycerol glycerophosphotransferase family protein [Microlunatus sp.]|nr:CDP-glycerol glycerophosphotransferase family protein [Microlunatus sp.]